MNILMLLLVWIIIFVMNFTKMGNNSIRKEDHHPFLQAFVSFKFTCMAVLAIYLVDKTTGTMYLEWYFVIVAVVQVFIYLNHKFFKISWLQKKAVW